MHSNTSAHLTASIDGSSPISPSAAQYLRSPTKASTLGNFVHRQSDADRREEQMARALSELTNTLGPELAGYSDENARRVCLAKKEEFFFRLAHHLPAA